MSQIQRARPKTPKLIARRGLKAMRKQIIAVLQPEEVRLVELAANKVSCAKQLLHPAAAPAYTSAPAKNKFFREAIFAYADADYLHRTFWRDLGVLYGIRRKDLNRLILNYGTRELFIET
jgi:hypothetical protein